MIKTFKPTEDNFKILGRTETIDDILYIDYSCSGIEFEFTGSRLDITLCSNCDAYEDTFKACVAIFINDNEIPHKRFIINIKENKYTLFESKDIQTVKVKFIKMSEVAFAKLGIKSIQIYDFKEIKKVANSKRRIEFIGDSITCGYGNEGKLDVDEFNTAQENPWMAYASKTARKLSADYNLVSWSGIGVISSYTEENVPNDELLIPKLYKYTDMDLDKILGIPENQYNIWNNSKFIPDLVVINLGTNDFSYTKDIKERINYFEKGYLSFLKQVRQANPSSTILCILGVMGDDLYPSVEKCVSCFSKEFHDNNIFSMHLTPQNEADGIGTDSHPSLITHDKLSIALVNKIKEIMNW
ncbi:SGNH/GDSL hydrolase family protein [Clostridium sp. SM-530-WT-3G]|uniref:SGNH/GDSL hydrolase family protein n=1 Tax=Clostridium sp. SM-530-WT-3G TaxID=2725303 RepID=UPI00145D1872|nr:SGNH/GDSL hydrolase family protein [Clostridium sp. SM-530-WT-3G]NME81815.1 SGNH/GDSL hydrolase family protein [Clostridium sp. SM-530-WT-3G]